LKYQNDFEARMLYDQTCRTEEGYQVYTVIYAVLWSYPGAMSKTSARVKLSSVFTYENNSLGIIAATIEKWRNEGWSLLDDYHDERYEFDSIEKLRTRLLNQAKSFLMGIPLDKIDSDYVPDDPEPVENTESVDQAPFLSVIQFDKSKENVNTANNKDKKEKNSSEKKDDDDFDFI